MYLRSHRNRGFTLVELMVSIFIMGMIMTVIVANQSTYSESAGLKNTADDISLSLREAQVYGISARETAAGSQDFDKAYGVVFNLASSGSNASYITFIDQNSNGVYGGDWSCNSNAGCLSVKNLPKNNTISSLCLLTIAGVANCGSTRLDITFLRPDTAARIQVDSSSLDTANYKGVRINLISSPNGNTRSVDIYTTGQISVQ
jgi:prepilin-type N-terminal cleavage/methylation domain-containing protein